MNRNKGFNIIEVAISIMIVSIAILMIIAIYTNIIKAQAKGIGKTIASSVAERVIQDLIAKKIKTTDINSTNLKNIGKDIVNDNVYYFYYKISKINADTNLYQVDIVVYYDLSDNMTEEQIKQLNNTNNTKNSVRFSRLITFSDDD